MLGLPLRVAIVIAQLEILLGAARLEQRDKEAAVGRGDFRSALAAAWKRACVEAPTR